MKILLPLEERLIDIMRTNKPDVDFYKFTLSILERMLATCNSEERNQLAKIGILALIENPEIQVRLTKEVTH